MNLRINPVLLRMDRVCSVLAAAKKKKLCSRRVRQLRRLKYRLIDKVRNLVADAHRRTCKWLCETFQFILIGNFETSRMCHAMYTWSHYAFRQRLLDYAQKFSFKRVLRVSEYYTSKTCGGCGALNFSLGASKTFVCPVTNCDVRGDRDILASRNIFLRRN